MTLRMAQSIAPSAGTRHGQGPRQGLIAMVLCALSMTACARIDQNNQRERDTSNDIGRHSARYCLLETPAGSRGPLISPERVADCATYDGYYVAYSVDLGLATRFLDDWADHGHQRISRFVVGQGWPEFARSVRDGCGPIAILPDTDKPDQRFNAAFACDGYLYEITLTQDALLPVAISVSQNEPGY